ncbi:MAG: chloride channel protein [Anaerolineae bacterium]|nr:chloride channel protein [Anaerolineae bacterium]
MENTLLVQLRESENAGLFLLATLLGLVTGIGIWIFRAAIDGFHEIFSVWLASNILGSTLGPVAFVLSLALAGAVVGLIMDRFIGEERHHGVAGIIEAVAVSGGRLRYHRIPYKAIASALSLGAGASVGPEDPSVQIGANLGSWFGQGLRLREEHIRLLVAAGAASAIAAAFKAPIAGVFFAIEVVLNGAFETRSFGVIVLAAVISSAFTQAVEPMPEIGPFTYSLGSPLEIPLFVPLGLIVGIVSALFMRAVTWQHDLWHHYVHLPRPIKTALAGAMVGLVAIFLPQIMGTGREFMGEVLNGHGEFTILFLLLIVVGKILMTAVSMAGGFVGGIFAPTLVAGVALGAAYGDILKAAFPTAMATNPQAYAIAGMAALMAGVVRSPITAIMLVFELTNDYRLILPIMLATAVSVFAAEHIHRLGIYMDGLQRKGVFLTPGRDIDLMQGVLVEDAMLKPAPSISASASLGDLRDALRKQHINSLCVIGEQNELMGIVTLSDLQRAYKPDGDRELTVGDICTREVITVYPDDVLWTAIRQMSLHDIGRLPVVKRNSREVIGFIGRHGIMRAYNIAINRKMADQHVAERIRLNALTGGHAFEFSVPAASGVVNKAIKDIAWPSDSVVASITRNGKFLIPHGDSVLVAGDLLTIVADPELTADLRELIVGTT